MMQLSTLMHKISKLVNETSFRCYNLEIDSSAERELFCAKAIVMALNNSDDILSLLSKPHRQDLMDSLTTHGKRYLKRYSKYPELKDEALIFQNSLDGAVKKISTADKNKIALQNLEIDLLSEQLYKILQKIQLFFSSQSQNKNSLEFIHALSIVYKIGSISLQEQIILTNLLIFAKELWYTEYKIANFKEVNILSRFYLAPTQILQINADDLDAEAIFNVIIQKLTSTENSVLTHLPDEHILSLYDRLKNHEESVTVFELLKKIHKEAWFRYSYNKLDDTKYQLLSRFQNFDAISHQIENLSFNVLEAYLFKKPNFTKEILVSIAKHSHNIKALSINKNKNLIKTLNHIDKKLKNQSKGADGSVAMLSNVKISLNKPLPSKVKKHYSELDKFHNTTLQKKYSDLFLNIVSIFEDRESSKEFLQNILTYRLASDYHLPRLSNSINKLRSQALDRKKVVYLLSELNFLTIFSPGNFNNITSFDFRKSEKIIALISPVEYVKSLIDSICLNINAFQLETLYKSVAYNIKLTTAQVLLIDSIKIQIKQRMTVSKLLYSIVSGKKKEYNKLKLLKKIYAESQMVVNS